MFDTAAEREGLIDTRVNFWPSLVDGMTSVLIIMFLLYIMKGMAGGELEAIRARRAMEALERMIEGRFQRAGLGDVVRCQYSTNILRVTFSEGVLFDPRQYRLQQRGRRVLAICADVLKSPEAPPYEQIQVEGHTDSVPFADALYPHDNWELSSARALEVLKHLLALGVRPQVISANGYADQVKMDKGRGPEADRKNRRIELRVIYSIPGLAAKGRKS